MAEEIKLEILVEKLKEGKYFKVPFDVQENVCNIDIYYSYKHYFPGPVCDISCCEFFMDDIIAYEDGKKALFTFSGLVKGDII